MVFILSPYEGASKSLEFLQWWECLCCFWWAPQTTPEFILVRNSRWASRWSQNGAGLARLKPTDQKIRALIYMESARPPGRRELLETEFTHMAKGSTNEGFKWNPNKNYAQRPRWNSHLFARRLMCPESTHGRGHRSSAYALLLRPCPMFFFNWLVLICVL